MMRFCYEPIFDADGNRLLDAADEPIEPVPKEMTTAPWLASETRGHTAIALTVSPAEMEAAVTIVERYIDMTGKPENRATHLLDLLILHTNICPLDLEAMAAGSDLELAHDVENAFFHIDRNTGRFGERAFYPRFAAGRKSKTN